MCYKDKTFCISPECKNECGRQLTEEIKKNADKWWGEGAGEAPISVSCFCGGDLKQLMEGKENVKNN